MTRAPTARSRAYLQAYTQQARARQAEMDASATDRSDVIDFLRAAQNANTRAAYDTGIRAWIRWVDGVNAKRRDGFINAERPEECHIAAHMRYMVETCGLAMATVNTRVSAISDSIRFITSRDYDPCAGRLVAQMRAVLTPRAKATTQRRELKRAQLQALITAAHADGSAIGRRDAAMFSLAFTTFLRCSEVARMNRGDVTFVTERVDGADTRIMRVHVDRQCKNDAKRLGHERLVRMHGRDMCAATIMEAHLRDTQGAASDPLFTQTRGGERLATSTPGGRLTRWLKAIHAEDVAAYGFHSLRAGGATHAAQAGVAVRHIKELGNWKSDAVNVYMRADTRDRLRASDALGREAR